MPRHLMYLSQKLTQVANGQIRRLMVQLPPRHGKSFLASQYFPAWYLGRHPDRRVMLCSYGAEFAAEWGRKARDVLTEFGPWAFNVRVRGDSSAANRWDIEGNTGGMVTSGARGAQTGRGAGLLVIDDPIKNAEESSSQTVKDKIWEWYTSTAYTRLEPDGAIVLIMTRWAMDDLAGRMLQQMEDGGEAWEVVRLPALAEENDPLGRKPGEALWPERFSVADLERIKGTMLPHSWYSLYQQRPVPKEGALFTLVGLSKFVTVPPAEVTGRVRYWDKGYSAEGDWTVGARMCRTSEGLFYLEDVVRIRELPHERNRIIKATAEADDAAFGVRVPVYIEQPPGAGTETTKALIRELAGHKVAAVRPVGAKEERAEALAAQVAAGNVYLVRAPWNRVLVDELTVFPHGENDDQVDACSGAFTQLANARKLVLGM